MRYRWVVAAAAASVTLVVPLPQLRPLAPIAPSAPASASDDQAGETTGAGSREASGIEVVGAGPVQATDEEVLPGPIIVETTDPSVVIDDAETVALIEQAHDVDVHSAYVAPVDPADVDPAEPADVDPAEPGLDGESDAADLGDPEQQAGASANATSGGLLVSYRGLNGGPLPPAGVQSVVAQTVGEWDRALRPHPAAPVVVDVGWGDLGSPSVLGTAGPQSLIRLGSGAGTSYYPVALANTLSGSDLNGPTVPELIINLNSTANWHVGTGEAPRADQVDLYTVALHEIGHGLGFIGSARCPKNAFGSCDGPPSLTSPPFVYDRLVSAGGSPLTSLPDASTYLTGGQLYVHADDGTSHQVYTPDHWREGLSFSHFDEQAYPRGACGALMSPTIRASETARGLDAATLGVMAGIGWPMDPPPPPQAVTAGTSGLTVTVSWAAPYCAGATSYTVERSAGGASWTSVGSTSALSLSAAVPVGTHQFRVRATDSRGAGEYGYTPPVGVSAELVRPVPLDGQVSRLYQAYFGREPDPAGFSHWLGQRASGVSLGAIADWFAASDEFANSYGRLSDAQFVDRVYQNILGRPADAEGRAYWVNQLDRGRSRGSVMIGFSESGEFITRTGTAPPITSITGEVHRMYVAFFRRPPDPTGLAFWTTNRSRGVPLDQIASDFASSAEFIATYGSVSDSRFVELAYANVFGRAPDATGAVYWRNHLAAGMGRGSLMTAFSQSTELIVATGTLP